jgi:hypothetical protein
LSFTDFKEITVNSPGTSLRYGGDDLKAIMQILNGKIVGGKRPKILNEWIWIDHFDMAPPATAPVAPTDTNASRIYIDPTSFKLRLKKTNDTIVDIENVDIPEGAIQAITNRAKIPSAIAYEDEANVFAALQTVNKTAEAAAAELIQLWKVADDANSYFRIENASSAEGQFIPRLSSYHAGSTSVPLRVFSFCDVVHDTGTNALFRFAAARVDNTAITTRPLFRIDNLSTAAFIVTPTQIDLTSKTIINPGNVVLNTQNNNLGDFYLDFGDIAAPANPSAGTRRVYVDSTSGQLSVRTSAGTSISLETSVSALDDLTNVNVPTPTTNHVLTFDGTNWVSAAAPGASGGEANTVTNVGIAGVGIYKTKTGVDFKLKKINAGSNKVTITDDTTNDEVDVDVDQANFDLESLGGSITTRSKLPSPVAYEDEANTFTLMQTITKAAEASIAETLQQWKVADDATAYLKILNTSAVDARFIPGIEAYQSVSSTSSSFTLTAKVLAASDDNVSPAIRLDARRDTNAALTTKSLLGVFNNAVAIFEITPTEFDFTNKTLKNAVIASTVTGIVDTNIAAHTSTKITISDRTLLNTAIAYEDETNVFTSGQRFTSFLDVARIATPANPVANDGRVYIKQIDANNDGAFALLKKDGVFGEVQLG